MLPIPVILQYPDASGYPLVYTTTFLLVAKLNNAVAIMVLLASEMNI